MATVRVLLGDTNPESRAVLEPLCAEQGWELLAVESSFQILRMIRDTSEIALVVVNPALPGSGVSGKDVARTIKTSSQFSALPVLFVLHEGQAMPEGCAVNGAIEIDRSGPARLLAAMREAMGLAGDGDEAAPVAEPSPDPEAPRAVATDAGGAMAAVAPMPEHAAPTRAARVVVADTDARTRGVLDPLFARQGWEMVAVESGFQVLRAVRDSEVDLVLINPSLQASGVSGADIARTIKGASQFRKLPVYFVVHEGQTPPKATVDGVIELGAWPPARILSTLNVAMGRSHGAVVTAPAPAPPPAPAEPESLEGPPPLEEAPEPPPMPRATTAAAPAELMAQLREEMFAEIRRAVASETRHAVERAGSAGGEDAGVSEETVERLVREEVASLAGSPALAEQLLPQIREEARQEVRRATEGSREALEQAVRSIAQELLPGLSAGMAAEAPPAVPVDEVVAQLREQFRQEIRGALEAATKQVETDGRAAVEAAARQYLEGEGRGIAEPLIAAMARELVPGLAERLLQHELARLPSPAAKIDELLPQIREQIGAEARRAAEAVGRQHAEREARGAMESAARHYLAAEGHALAEPLLAALAREVMPPLAERLVRQQLDHLPSPGAKVDELLPPLREQILQEARRAVEAIVRRYTETEGRSLVDQLIRQFAVGQGATAMEEILRAAARETVPKVAERLVQQELGRGPSATARIDQLLAEMREEARRNVEAVARRYAESDGRSVVDSVMRQFASTQGVSLAEELLRAAAREIVPAIAERLVQQELGRLPSPAAKLDELLPAIRDQILQEGRRAAEAVARRYAETDGRAIIESVIRQHTATHGTRFPEELVRGVARELVPAVAERLIREEIARLRREYRLD
jgi:CheY-like chemotaxis protein